MFINYLPLSTHNINDFMQHHIRKCTLFRGVYAADELKKIKVVPGIYIINCDTSNLPGSHWICIYFSPMMQGYYFDSYGIPPYIPQHKYFLIKNSKHCWKYNKVELQSLDSSVCGRFASFRRMPFSRIFFDKWFMTKGITTNCKIWRMYFLDEDHYDETYYRRID